MSGILIISGDWQSRTLLRAQLIEDKCDVRAFTSPQEAKGALAPPAAYQPALVLADLSSFGREEVETLDDLVRGLPAGVPLWIIASRGGPDEGWIELLKGPHLEKALFRPADAGELVEQIKARTKCGR